MMLKNYNFIFCFNFFKKQKLGSFGPNKRVHKNWVCCSIYIYIYITSMDTRANHGLEFSHASEKMLRCIKRHLHFNIE